MPKRLDDKEESVLLTVRVPLSVKRAIARQAKVHKVSASAEHRQILIDGTNSNGKTAKPPSRVSGSLRKTTLPCRHPVSRRIGNACGICGADVR